MLIPHKPRKAQIIQLSCGWHLMKTSINMGTLELTIWLCLLDGSAPHRSVGMEMAAAKQLSLQLLLQPWRQGCPQRCLWLPRARQNRAIPSGALSPARRAASPCTPFASQPLFPCRDSSEWQLCQGDKPPSFSPCLHSTSFSLLYPSQPHSSPFSSASDTPFLQRQAQFFCPLVKMINWKYFFSGKTQDLSFNFCLLVCFILENTLFGLPETFYLTYMEKSRKKPLPYEFPFSFITEIFQNRTHCKIRNEDGSSSPNNFSLLSSPKLSMTHKECKPSPNCA